jgi:MOSC domain-containing protein YiiM
MEIAGLFVKPKVTGERGLPKHPVERMEITREGAEGDYNRYRHERRKNDPEQAVLLLAAEILEDLAAEGWAVRPGDLGENVLLRGVPYEALEPGRRLRLGEVELEVTRRSMPCQNLQVLPYVGKKRLKAFVKTLKLRRGWYARVLRGGPVDPASPVELETMAAEKREP